MTKESCAKYKMVIKSIDPILKVFSEEEAL